MPTTIALLHPGEMGAAVGASLVANGHRVVWVATGRSAATRERAEDAGLMAASSLQQALAVAHVVLSVCPPHAALTLAEQIAGHGFRGIYVDANAVAPATARHIGELVEANGHMHFVDGGLIGPPPIRAGSTRFYLAGPAAQNIAELFTEGPLEACVLEGGAGAAAALKMSYAAYTKGVTALLTSIRAVASQEGVDDALLAEWERSLPGTAARSQQIENQARKAWRWEGEMQEIANTFAAAGLPDGFHRAAAELYQRLEGFKSVPPPAALSEVLAAVAGSARSGR